MGRVERRRLDCGCEVYMTPEYEGLTPTRCEEAASIYEEIVAAVEAASLPNGRLDEDLLGPAADADRRLMQHVEENGLEDARVCFPA